MKYNKTEIPNWLISSILYGVSWSMMFKINLSFLAWVAFIPLFFTLEKRNSFWEFFRPAFLFSFFSYFISCHGFLIVPKNQQMIYTGALFELIMATLPFAILYPFKKKFGFDKALILFPFIIALWEWLYQKFDHTFGYLMLSHSQCQNIWLIQYIDLFGVWSIASWTMAFNVLLYFQLKKIDWQEPNLIPFARIVLLINMMILPPLGYAIYRYYDLQNQEKETINITLINSNFSLFYKGNELYAGKIDRLIQITDSTDNQLKTNGHNTDMYVWHEGAVDHGTENDFYTTIISSIDKWQAPLLTGMQVVPLDSTKTNFQRVNRATLIQKNTDRSNYESYNKNHLAPGSEKIPYNAFLQYLPGFPHPNDPRWYKPGDKTELIHLSNRNGIKVNIGTPICLEQNYPEIWNSMVKGGANCFVQLSYESWWSLDYFKQQLSYISRLRAIETRRAVARCSNGGNTMFIDEFGNIGPLAKSPESSLTSSLNINYKISFFTRFQWFFPVSCLFSILILSILFIRKKSLKKS